MTVQVEFSEKVQSFPSNALTFSNDQGTRQDGSTLHANPNIDATQLTVPDSDDNLTWTFDATAPNDDAEAIYKVSIDGTSILDYHGQPASNGSASWTHDAIHPTVLSIASDKVGGKAGSLRSNQTMHELTFKLSEAVSGVTFLPEDVTVTKNDGDLALASLFNSDSLWNSIDGNTYRVVVNLAVANNDVVTVSVAAEKFQDAVGNLNLANLSYTFTYDAQTPSITSVSVKNKNTDSEITSSLDPLVRSNASEYEVTFTLSEKSGTYGAVSALAFSIEDLDLTNVQSTPLTTDDDGQTWSGTFTALNNNAKCLISKKANSLFTDTAGNSSQTDIAVDLVSWTHDLTRPTVKNVDYNKTYQALTSSVVNGKDPM